MGLKPGIEMTKEKFLQGLNSLAQDELDRKRKGEKTFHEQLNNAFLIGVMESTMMEQWHWTSLRCAGDTFYCNFTYGMFSFNFHHIILLNHHVSTQLDAAAGM